MIFFPFFLFTNSNFRPSIDPKLFLKTFCYVYVGGSLLLTNGYASYETYQKIKECKGCEKIIAKELKEDFKKESWIFKPFMFGEYLTAELYLKNNKD